VESSLRLEISGLRQESKEETAALRQAIVAVESSLRQELIGLRQESREEAAALRKEMEQKRFLGCLQVMTGQGLQQLVLAGSQIGRVPEPKIACSFEYISKGEMVSCHVGKIGLWAKPTLV